MDQNKFAVMMEMLVPQVISLIVKHKCVEARDAIGLFYASKLYERLEVEETKLWHLSARTLYELLDEEITTGEITYPEEA